MVCTIISGASSGIGRQTAITLSKSGHELILLGRDAKKLNSLAEKLPNPSHIFTGDLGSPAVIEEFAKRFLSKSGDTESPITGLVNNAGMYHRREFEEESPQSWQEVFSVNVFASFHLTQKVLPVLKSSKSSSIVNIASTLGERPVAGTSIYSASKAALINWTQTLALEMAPFGLRANVICPGIVDTPIHDFHRNQSQEAETLRQELAKMHPMGRLGQPEDVAAMVRFLCSPEASWITGSVFDVDGGIHLV